MRKIITGRSGQEDDPSLSDAELAALKKICAPADSVGFPPPEIIRTLRQHGYAEIVLGGLQVTQKGLERLIRERNRAGGS